MKAPYWLFALPICIGWISCEQKPADSDLRKRAISSIGWQGDEHAARIFETPSGYLLFGSTNSFAPGTYDAVVCRLDESLRLINHVLHGGTGDERVMGTEAIQNSAGQITGYLAWGTVKDASRSDRDIWLLFTDAMGLQTGEKRIRFSSQAVDDLPVSVRIESDNILIAANTARLTTAGYIESAGWIRLDVSGNVLWQHIQADSVALSADGLLETDAHKSWALCHTMQGELRIVEVRDPLMPGDTPTWKTIARRQETGLQEGGNWLKGTDNHYWFYCTHAGLTGMETHLLRFNAAAQFIDKQAAGAGPHEKNGPVCLHPKDAVYPVKWLSTQQSGSATAQTRMAVYFRDQYGVQRKEPVYYGGSFSNVPADIIQTGKGDLLLLGSHTAPNRPGGDFVLFRLNAQGELP